MPTTVKEYLVTRLAALGGQHLFCVAGNYTAEFLLAAHDSGLIQCVPTTNEMEAGYAADAYARLSRRIGVCCVTYGVGSFGLLNAFAGSYVEYCPVVLINGSAPASKAEQLVNQGVLFAHAIDPVRTDELVFRQITDPLRRPGDPPLTAIITDPFDAPEQIDELLRACVATGRPVYLEVRQNIWGMECASPSDPDTPLAPMPPRDQADRDTSARAAVRAALERIRRASRPVLWGGELLQRMTLEEEFKTLLQQSGLPYTTTLMGKGLISEAAYPQQFIGVYDSVFAPVKVKEVVEQSDCLIGLGTLLGDFYGRVVADHWTGAGEEARLIVAAATGVRIGNDLYPDVPLKQFVTLLAEEWPRGGQGIAALAAPETLPGLAALVQDREATLAHAMARTGPVETKITWDSFFERIGSWVTPDMVLLLDASLALFPAAEIPVHTQGRFVTQSAWLSIGYTVGAAVGASFAVPEGLPVAFAGDGGFQMIAQAFSTLVKHGRRGVVFVFDNQLYGIEQYLVDMQVLPQEKRYFPNPNAPASFFDLIPDWDYVKLAEAFGGKGYAVSTHAELERVLGALAGSPDEAAIVAITLDPKDLPKEIKASFSAAPAPPAAAMAAEPEGGREPRVVAVAAFN